MSPSPPYGLIGPRAEGTPPAGAIVRQFLTRPAIEAIRARLSKDKLQLLERAETVHAHGMSVEHLAGQCLVLEELEQYLEARLDGIDLQHLQRGPGERPTSHPTSQQPARPLPQDMRCRA